MVHRIFGSRSNFRNRLLSMSILVAVLLGACGTPAPQPPASYSDPFAYCGAVGTVDAPDARYTGEAMPAAVLDALVRQGVVSADAPPKFQKNAVWRCMDGQVWACHFGANLPCEERADTSQVPTAEMEAFCQSNASADVIPAAVTGRATVYEWRCSDGQPAVVKQVFTPDAQGFVAGFWFELTP